MTYLTVTQVTERYQVSRATVYRWRASGLLPEPVYLTPASPRYRLEDLEEWENSMKIGT